MIETLIVALRTKCSVHLYNSNIALLIW